MPPESRTTTPRWRGVRDEGGELTALFFGPVERPLALKKKSFNNGESS